MSEMENSIELAEKASRLETLKATQAIHVHNAFKKYGNKKTFNVILDGLNMTVPKGCIYGLLGASGCGKTTLLSCISGRLHLDDGEIWVLGSKPGSAGSGIPGPRIGYMPQETALIKKLSIRESLYYFGWIHGMSTEQIDLKVEYLIDLLLLPSAERYIEQFSGGQQRRVSLACAMLHEPELLILDEPTSGVDPMLRQSIWDHLVKITSDGKTTVVITTHYIEETRQAHMVGLMRNGCLLAEESPEDLLRRYNSDSLENVFLKLSVVQNRTKCSSNIVETEIANSFSIPEIPSEGTANMAFDSFSESSEQINKSSSSLATSRRVTFCDQKPQVQSLHLPTEKNGKISLHKRSTLLNANHMKALLWKNLLSIWRSVGTVLLIIGLPITQMVSFCICVGDDPVGLSIGIVNGEINGRGIDCTFIPAMLQPQTCNLQINVTSFSDCTKPICIIDRLSCQYLELLGKKQLSMIYYHNVEEAKIAVRKDRTLMVVEFSSNFTYTLLERYKKGRELDMDSFDASEINVWMDQSNYVIFQLLRKDLYDAWNDLMDMLSQSCNYDIRLFDIPFKINNPIYGTLYPNFRDFAAPGMIILMAFFIGVSFTSGAMLTERNEGILARNLVIGVTEIELLLGHAGTQFIIIVFQALLLVAVPLSFGLTNSGSIFTMYTLTILTGLLGSSFAVFVFNTIDSEQSATALAQGFIIASMFLSGLIWPVEGMPLALRYISYSLPLTTSTESLRSIVFRGWTMNNPKVYLGFVSVVTWTALLLSVSILLIKFKRG